MSNHWPTPNLQLSHSSVYLHVNLNALLSKFKIQQFSYDCSLTCVAIVIDSLFNYSTAILTTLLDSIKDKGLTLSSLTYVVCVLWPTNQEYPICTTHFMDQTDTSRFRQAVVTACSNSNYRMIINFNRAILGQYGSGHYSLVGACSDNHIWLLDVGRRSSHYYWVGIDEMVQSMRSIDPESGRCRGWVMIQSDLGYIDRVRHTLCQCESKN
jgi:hypothetical protein